LTWISIVLIGGYTFTNIGKISGLLEGWIISFVIQEVPMVIFELSNYLFLAVEEKIKFKL
jgi:hypothetical protein